MINLYEGNIIIFSIALLIFLNYCNKNKINGGTKNNNKIKYDFKTLNEVYFLNKNEDINKFNNIYSKSTYLLVYKNERYFIKISGFLEKNIRILKEYYNNFLKKYFNNKSDKQNIIKNLPSNTILLNDNLYEANMYKKIKSKLSKKEQDNIVEMIDYGFFDINNKDFSIQINNNIFNLSENNLTGEIYSKGNIIKKIPNKGDLITDILNKINNTETNSYLVYIITKCYINYDTLWNAIHIHNFNKYRLEMYIINTIKILQKLKKKINFSHNDLHSHNLLVNIKKQKIKLFDFDKSTSFKQKNKNKKNKNKQKNIYILEQLYKDSSFIIFQKINMLFSDNPPTNNKELQYTLDLFRLIVEPYLDINEIVLNINLNITIDFQKFLPKNWNFLK